MNLKPWSSSVIVDDNFGALCAGYSSELGGKYAAKLGMVARQ